METVRLVALTVLGISAIGAAIFSVAPAHWELCEVALLAAGVFLVRECISNYNAEKQMRQTRDPSGGGASWNSNTPAYAHARSRQGRRA